MIAITLELRGKRHADKKNFSSTIAWVASRGKVAVESP